MRLPPTTRAKLRAPRTVLDRQKAPRDPASQEPRPGPNARGDGPLCQLRRHRRASPNVHQDITSGLSGSHQRRGTHRTACGRTLEYAWHPGSR